MTCAIAFTSNFIALVISHRGTVSKINENEEGVSMVQSGLLSELGAALSTTVAAFSASIGAAAVLG
ncbi:MAG: hypothetical protein M3332_09605 [Actinomycetota bacterium]|nr:hypothetical protein [Actinomycetota bacterium]